MTGVNSMVSAYSLVPGKEKELAVSSARSELKDCMQQLLQLEQQLEQQMLGTLRLQMQGIQGFARLCAGDQFEITIRCGTRQKWKCRGKILKDNVQSWDCSEQLFRPGLHEPLVIRAVELRGLTKKICLGEKQCELRHLLAARPQLMSICLNTTGTLKLHLIATWNPLHMPATDVSGKSATLGSVGVGGGLTKSKSFLGSSTSLLARWTGSGSHHQPGTLSNNYSGLSKSISSYNVGTMNSLGGVHGVGGPGSHMGTLSGGSIASGQMEILDVDYYHHPHLFNGSETGARLARQSSALSERLRPTRPHSYHPSNGGPCLTPIPSPTGGSPCPEESPRALSPDNGSVAGEQENSRAESHVDSVSGADPSSGHHSTAMVNSATSPTAGNNVSAVAMDGNRAPALGQQSAGTPSSTSSRGSSIHLTGTSSSGFGSSSSYCGSSMPNSTLTSPDCESPPATNSYCNDDDDNHHHRHHCPRPSTSTNHKEIIVQATVHPEPPPPAMEMPRSCSMPAALTTSNALSATAPRHQNFSSTPSSSLTSPEMPEQSANGHHMETYSSQTQAQSQPPPPAQLFFNVTDTLINLISALEDIQGQYSELGSLHQHVLDLYRLCCQMGKLRASHTSLQQQQICSSSTNSSVARNKNRIRRKSDASEISMSVESALECFDFLNQVTTDSDSSPEHELHNTSESLRSVRATKAAFAAGRPLPPSRSSSIRGNADSSYPAHYGDTTSITSSTDEHHSSHSQHQHRMNGSTTSDDAHSVDASPAGQANDGVAAVDEGNTEGGTGSEQLDIALMSHLTYCQRLLENLGAFGPLRSRERHSLDKLRAQSQPLATLVRLCVNARDHLQFTLQLRQDHLGQVASTNAEEAERFEGQLRTAFHRLQTAQRAELHLQTSADTRVARLWQLVCAMHANPNAFGGSPPGMNITSQPFEDQLLCVTSAGFVWALAQFTRVHALRSGSTFQPPLAWLSDEGQNLQSTCQLITQRLLDAPTFETDYVVTVLQVRLYLTEEGASVEHLLRAHAQEAQLLHVLCTGDPLAVKGALRKFKRTLPPREPLHALALLLLRPDQLLVSVVQQHFVQAAANNSLRTAVSLVAFDWQVDPKLWLILIHLPFFFFSPLTKPTPPPHQMIDQFVEALENDSPAVRQAACLVLLILGSQDCLEQLAFVCCADTEPEVRAQARQTLLNAGPRGTQLYEESQLFTNGFQGLTVK